MISTPDPLYHDADLADLYDLDNEWGADLDYCLKLGREAACVLDLGCGTGRLVVALAHERSACGVDPAAAMLAVARRRPGGTHATWIVGDARSVRLDRTFELVVMTGHAFQTLQTPADQAAALATMTAHLAPNGRFIFDMRNPALEEWRQWTPEQSLRRLEHPSLSCIEAWNDVQCDELTGLVGYETHYRILATGRLISATASQLRFTPKDELACLIAAAGLAVDRWLGDWQGSDWTIRSPEIIPCGRLLP
jgi:ubiquinone/menaquinone biosynthesis C-methylase UbiE